MEMGDDIYERLRGFLDTLPTGFPSTPTGVELRILKKLFTPEEAELTMNLRSKPEGLSQIAAPVWERSNPNWPLSLRTWRKKGLFSGSVKETRCDIRLSNLWSGSMSSR
jgi:hypothetical protein